MKIKNLKFEINNRGFIHAPLFKFREFQKLFLNKSGAGFTLTEMLVGILVFSIIIGSISGIFVTSVKEQRRILTSQILLDQTSYALEYMSRALRMAKKELFGESDCLSQDGLNYEIAEVEPGINGLKFKNHLQGDDCQAFFLKNGQLKYKKDLDTASPQTFDLTSNDLNITSLNFYLSGENQTDSLQPKVTFSLEVEGKSGLVGSQPKIRIQSTVSQRMLDVFY